MKILTLNYAKWKCGGYGKHKLGRGRTFLLNTEGFMCCLGQWSLQKGASIQEIVHKGSPNELKKKLTLLSRKTKYGIVNTEFSTNAICINDDIKTTPAEKIKLLRALTKKYKYTLRVINKNKI